MDLVIDETLERRWGCKISKRGHYRDSALSSLVTLFGRALHPDGQVPVARVSLVSQADRHLL